MLLNCKTLPLHAFVNFVLSIDSCWSFLPFHAMWEEIVSSTVNDSAYNFAAHSRGVKPPKPCKKLTCNGNIDNIHMILVVNYGCSGKTFIWNDHAYEMIEEKINL